jgi:predicted AAA+ superfamily ATPase
MVDRPIYRQRVNDALRRSPICALLGPRQCGKTTLARAIVSEIESHYFDIESPRDLLRLQNPELALSALSGLVVIDEVQSVPGLFPVLRVLADREDVPARFLILGSASPDLIRQSSETLAGRVEFVDLHGFDINETGTDTARQLWTRGGFPRSFLAGSEADSVAWREGFVRTFLERDLPQFGVRVNAQLMRRFWTMLAHWHGQLWGASELSRALGVSDKTVKAYLDDLTQTYMIRQLQPWFENIAKRQVKSPKIYVRDSGLLHHLLGMETHEQLAGHPKVGASWEGFALEQVLRLSQTRDAYFWATQSGAELDLLVFRGGARIGYEFKHTENPAVTRSMRTALNDLGLAELRIVYPGNVRSRLDARIEAVGLSTLVSEG